MTCTKFKLTTVAALVFAATNANAALYKVVEVTPSFADDPEISEIFGVAIQPGKAVNANAELPALPDDELPLGCFDSNATNCADDAFKLAGETRNTVEGVSYREEVPFAMDASFGYIQEYDDFENYCYRELKYSTCESWASSRWSTWSKERNDLSYLNAQAFIEDGAEFDVTNTVINSLDENAKPLGIQSNGNDLRNTAIITTTPPSDNGSETRAWGSLTEGSTTYNFGSISTNQTNDDGAVFSSKAAIWDGTTTKELDWIRGGAAQEGQYLAQGSMRALTIKDSLIYGVGYNTANGSGDLQDMNASIFISDSLDLSRATWVTKQVSGAEVNSGSSNDDARYSNSVVTDINKNLLAIGYAKRNGYVPESGSAANKVFVVEKIGENGQTPTANFNLQSSIFFTGAGGEAKSVNNFNEFVGQVDAETTREVDGSERRHRGFIYPYQATGTDTSRIALFESKAWWLDDLTNGANLDGQDYSDANNHFRIIDASDINDAGVISATAIKCTVGGLPQAYDTTAHNSYCGGAASNAVEEVVAVKLVPIAGATKADIQTRSMDTEKVDREGAGLGWLTLTVLGLLGFRRKFK